MIVWPPNDFEREVFARRILSPQWREDCAAFGTFCETPAEALESAYARDLLPAGWDRGAPRRWFVHPRAGFGEAVTQQTEVTIYVGEPLPSAEAALKATLVGAIFGGLIGGLAASVAKRPVTFGSLMQHATAGAVAAGNPFRPRKEKALAREPESVAVVQTLVALGDAMGQAEELAWEFSLRADESTSRKLPEIAWHVRDVSRRDVWLGLDYVRPDSPLSIARERVRAAVRPDQYDRAVQLAEWAGCRPLDTTAVGRAACALYEDYFYRRLRELVAAEIPVAASAVDLPVPYRAEQRPDPSFPPNVFEPLVELWRLGVAISSWTPDLVTLVCPPWSVGVV